jgi:hypothetical protein
MKNAVFWNVTPCGSCKTDDSEERRFLQEPHGVTSQKTAFFKYVIRLPLLRCNTTETTCKDKALLHNTQTVSAAQISSWSMGIGSCFLGSNRGRHEITHSPPPSTEVRNSGATPPFPLPSSRRSA